MRRIKAHVKNTLAKFKDFMVDREQRSASQNDLEKSREDLKAKAYSVHRRIV